MVNATAHVSFQMSAKTQGITLTYGERLAPCYSRMCIDHWRVERDARIEQNPIVECQLQSNDGRPLSEPAELWPIRHLHFDCITYFALHSSNDSRK